MSGSAQDTGNTYVLRHLGLQDYSTVFAAQRHFTDTRSDDTLDEFWLVEHPSVFTQGQAGKAEHLFAAGDIPVVQSDRGGQVTYHGPGQVVLYILLNLRRSKLSVRAAVTALESSVIYLLSQYGVVAAADPHAPGVYVEGAKVAALGLRVRKGCCYHGVALNVDLNLEPYNRINPCGYAGQVVTRLSSLGVSAGVAEVGEALAGQLARHLKYTKQHLAQGLPPAPKPISELTDTPFLDRPRTTDKL